MAAAAKKPSPKSKAHVGSTKKSSSVSMKLTMRTAVFGLVGILIFSIISGYGLQKWQDHQLKAHAYSYTYHYSSYGWYIATCRAGELTFYYYIVNPTGYTLHSYTSPSGLSFTVNPHSNSALKYAIVSSSASGISVSAPGYGIVSTGALYNQRNCS